MQNVERPSADPELKRRIQDLIAYKGEGHNADLVADVIENALKLMTDVEARGDVRVIQTAIRELRYAFQLFAPHAHAIVLFRARCGTLDDGYEALTLMQTGKSRIMPLVLMDKPGGTYWRTWDKQIRDQLLRNQFVSPDDLVLYQITDNTEQAVKI